ncbi:GGDEF domain-containing protein [Pelotalea chapellei]|uniref:diguanylate cyclase n=1 Tax=Pelotalea chapellei TaxID=44671 RepID=A0ABS5U877_9BACT|nr:GGDEF domain-containing protein [Pelotalea chapellei]MBT1071874.1 GGDEF domain-containing protein [Pelotalea chapellei]
MLSAILKRTPVFFIPTALLVAAWFLAPQIATLPLPRQELVTVAPYLAAAGGGLLAIHFHRGRPLFVLLMLAVSYRVFRSLPEQIEPAFNSAYQALVLLIPPNMALVALMRERGIFSLAGRVRLAFMVVQAFFFIWLFHYHFVDLLPYLARTLVSLPFSKCMLVPQPAMLLGALWFIVIAVLAIRRQAAIDSGILGALTAFFVAANGLTSHTVHTAFFVAGTVVVALSVMRDSHNLAFRDDLTGIPSRRALNEALHGLGRRYVVAMLDVDHFKKFNDSYGHAVGDQVLRFVAAKIAAVGGGGKAYRYGGEEFTILFPGRSAADVLPHLESVRETIANYRLMLRSGDRPADKRQGKGQRGSRGEGASVGVTISIGVAENADGVTAQDVIKAADKALYKAKNRGRNQISR